MRCDTNFPTIRQNARLGPVSEHYLRIMLKQGRLPGFYVGNHFHVNRKLFLAQLDEMSVENVTEDTNNE